MFCFATVFQVNLYFQTTRVGLREAKIKETCGGGALITLISVSIPHPYLSQVLLVLFVLSTTRIQSNELNLLDKNFLRWNNDFVVVQLLYERCNGRRQVTCWSVLTITLGPLLVQPLVGATSALLTPGTFKLLVASGSTLPLAVTTLLRDPDC